MGRIAQPLLGVTVAHVGHHDPGYSRNRILAKALTRAGASVVQVTDRRRFAARTLPLVRRAYAANPDVILVGVPGHSDLGAAKVVSMARGAPVLFDALIPLWEANVLDRRAVPARSLAARRYHLTDLVACFLADTVLTDTAAHAEWLREEFGLPASKLRRIWVGADDELMTPCDPPPPRAGECRVFFYGSFIPLHGIEHIIGAAALLDEVDDAVRFVLCGYGQTHRAMRQLAADTGVSNIEFLRPVATPELRQLICDSDICLGIFGTNPKAGRVIPNKLFDALACRRPVITADTPAARECLSDGETAKLCPAGDPGALADAIATLRADASLRCRIATAGHELFRRRFSLEALAADVGQLILETAEGPSRPTGAALRGRSSGR